MALATLSTLAGLLDHGQQRLTDINKPADPDQTQSARLDAQILLCHTLNIDNTRIYSSPEEIISESQQQAFLSQIEKRRDGLPIAHLTGTREFWSLDLNVNQHTLIPRPETELLVETALRILQEQILPAQKQPRQILDMGTGSGAIALALGKEYPDSHITATDFSSDALDVAQKNINQLNLTNISLKQGHWYAAVHKQRFNMIVSNPPYIAETHRCLHEGDVSFEPRLALTSGPEGLDALQEIIEKADQHLLGGGWIVLEHGYDQGLAVRTLLQANHFSEITTLKDYAGHDRISQAQIKPAQCSDKLAPSNQ